MINFIGYTTELECWINDAIKMVKCEYSRIDGGFMIHAVSGNNLGRIGGGFMIHAVSGNNLGRIVGGHAKNISQEAFEARPIDPYDDTVEAIWALKQIGLTPAVVNDDDIEE